MADITIKDVKSKISELQQLVQEGEKDGKTDLTIPECFAFAQKARELQTLTIPPRALGFEIAIMHQTATAARLAMDLRLFQNIVAAAPEPISAQQLAAKAQRSLNVPVDPTFITRTLRVLTHYGLATESAASTYLANHHTYELGDDGGAMRSWITHCFDQYMGPFQHSLKYFRENGYVFPLDPRKGPVQDYWGKEETSYERWQELDGVVENFNNFMKALESRGWFEWWSVEDKTKIHLREAGRPENGKGELLLIDVGGGKGNMIHDLRSQLSKAGIKGTLALEDQENVIQDALQNTPSGSGLEGVQYIPHDFLTPQSASAKGALYYYVHWILHNWSDTDCITILKHIAAAMTPGYSRLLINERVLMPVGNDLKTVGLDLHMAYAHAARERTLEEFEALVKEAGMKVVSVERAGDGGEDLVECMLV